MVRFPSKAKKRVNTPSIHTSIQICTQNCRQCNVTWITMTRWFQKKKTKNVFSRFNCMHVENPKGPMEGLLGLISKCKMIFGYKVNKQNQLLFCISTINTFNVKLKIVIICNGIKSTEYLLVNLIQLYKSFTHKVQNICVKLKKALIWGRAYYVHEWKCQFSPNRSIDSL